MQLVLHYTRRYSLCLCYNNTLLTLNGPITDCSGCLGSAQPPWGWPDGVPLDGDDLHLPQEQAPRDCPQQDARHFWGSHANWLRQPSCYVWNRVWGYVRALSERVPKWHPREWPWICQCGAEEAEQCFDRAAGHLPWLHQETREHGRQLTTAAGGAETDCVKVSITTDCNYSLFLSQQLP